MHLDVSRSTQLIGLIHHLLKEPLTTPSGDLQNLCGAHSSGRQDQVEGRCQGALLWTTQSTASSIKKPSIIFGLPYLRHLIGIDKAALRGDK